MENPYCIEDDFQEQPDNLEDFTQDQITDICEHCQNVATFYCEECSNAYCMMCSTVRHKQPSRANHHIVRLSTLPHQVSSHQHDQSSDQLEAQITGLMIKHFAIHSIKDWQLEMIMATLKGHNTLVVQPTGSGKSLCFQLLPLLTGKLTIVLTPTISLMKDQCCTLESKVSATFVGSSQTDKEIDDKILSGHFKIVYTTPEKFFDDTGTPSYPFSELIMKSRVGLIALDEVHLISSWKFFRPAFGHIFEFCKSASCPTMALTATATPSVRQEIIQHLIQTTQAVGSVNQQNIFYSCHELKLQPQGDDRYTQIAKNITPIISSKDQRVIVYVDFVKDAAPLAISLRQAGYSTCSYHGQNMSANDKIESMDSWRSGTVKIMVCTTAFGMGIDQPDVEMVIRIGCPPTLESMVQEFGRAGRDGRPARGILFYQESDLQHASFWTKTNTNVLQSFSHSWRFAYAHLHKKCRRAVLLEYFGEDATANDPCCDVCELSSTSTSDYSCEIRAVVQVVDELPTSGEKKIAQWIRGSADKTVQKLKNSTSKSFGCGNQFNHSVDKWRKLVRQAWLLGFLERSLAVGSAHNRMSRIIYVAYTVTGQGRGLLTEDDVQEVLLPDETIDTGTNKDKLDCEVEIVSAVRKGKGTHILNVAKELISDKNNWFPIKESKDYNFPGIFNTPFPQRLGYCDDITKLPNYESTDPHFLYSDIQIGKGKARPKRLIPMNIDGKVENVFYRFAPCGGIKKCSMHSDGCSHIVPTSSVKPCSIHPNAALERSGDCPVDFVYIWPADQSDNRRWLSGIIRCGDMHSSDLHNHPHHKESKIPVKVDTDIRRAVIENPHLKSSELLIGKGMHYLPGAASLAATNHSKIKNIRLSTLRETQPNRDPRSAIMSFETDAKNYDCLMRDKVEEKNLDEYSHFGHPYVRKYGIGDTFTWVLAMSPLMSEVFSVADCVEVDVTYKSCYELPYLFNVVAFNYLTMRWMVVGRVRMNLIDTDAYAECFRALFEQVASDHPTFKVGESLTGIIADWSDQQANGLEKAVGKLVARNMLKGCQVHFIRSVQRVAKKLNLHTKEGKETFIAVGQQILEAKSASEVMTLFDILRGEKPIDEANLPNIAGTMDTKEWKKAVPWVDWWMRKQHLAMLSPHFSTMTDEQFKTLPNSTNAVESHNRLSKIPKPEILSAAMLTTYKVDMAAALEHMARLEGLSTSYEDRSDSTRIKKNKAVQKSRSKRKLQINDDDGPPDKSKHFQSNPKKRKNSTSSAIDVKDKKSATSSAIDVNDKKKATSAAIVINDNNDDDDFQGQNTSWIPSLSLHTEHKRILQQKLWIDDAIINAAQKLLRHQFPNVGGFQSTLVVASKSCILLPAGAIQIIHIRSNHWVCIKVNEDKSIIYLYDSKYSSIPPTVADLIIDITYSERDTITIKSMKMQEQNGCDACGVFSLAVATALCYKQNPSILCWKQDAMWPHLLLCLEEGKMTPFPMETKQRSLTNNKDVVKAIITENLHCICRRRYKQKDKMKQCSECGGWFHADCLNIPANVLVKGKTWTCSICT